MNENSRDHSGLFKEAVYPCLPSGAVSSDLEIPFKCGRSFGKT